MRPAPLPQFQLVGTSGDFSAVGRLQPLHKVANVHLDRALAHLQFVGDDFVGFAEFEMLENGQLAGRQLLGRDRFGGGSLAADCSCRQNTWRHECSARLHKMNDFDRELDSRTRCRNVTAGAALEGRQYRLGGFHIAQDYDWPDLQKLLDVGDRLTSNVFRNTFVRMVQDEIVSVRAVQTVIARGELRDLKEIVPLPQRFGNAFARERMFIDHRNRDPRISFGGLTCCRP